VSGDQAHHRSVWTSHVTATTQAVVLKRKVVAIYVVPWVAAKAEHVKAVEIAFAMAVHKIDPWVLYAVRMSYWPSGLRRCQTFQTMVRNKQWTCICML
jgi:hypothetical protein